MPAPTTPHDDSGATCSDFVSSSSIIRAATLCRDCGRAFSAHPTADDSGRAADRELLAQAFIEAGYTTGAPREEMQGFVEIALSALSRKTAGGVVITDAMVEAAFKAYSDNGNGTSFHDGLNEAERGWYLQHMRAALQSALSVTAVPDGWRTMDSAPKDGTKVLVLGTLKRSQGFYQEVCAWYAPGKMGSGCWPVIWMDGYNEPTHWQPLPALPTAKASEGE